ncbi:hypothetical protein KPH14_009225 [Odynerus spinipes]|uniref:Odorant receptor n=1 Tax=Odynerus spinipes TaxID=1348599 RepID=A0AAD9VRA0_9HYME|nr:hypothetical protein KPH14_009225 [Odynerus spinipes]
MEKEVLSYAGDISYAMKFCRQILTPLGIWSLIYDRATRKEKILSLPLNIACIFSLCFVLIPTGLYVLIYETNINIRLKLLGPLSFCLTSMIKYCYFGLKGEAIGQCITHVENDWSIVRNQHHRTIMLEYATIGRNLIVLCVVFLLTGGISYHTIMPLFSSGKINENLTIRPHAYPGYDRYLDPQATPAYEIIFLMQFMCAMVMHGVTIAACSLAATFVTHACGQIQIVMARLNDLIDGKESKGTGFDERLAVIVHDHGKTLRFSVEIEKILREVCLMEVVASTLIICLLEYYCITEWENSDPIAILTYFILLLSFTFNIFIFCYIGELLVEQCKKVGTVSYNIEWYRLPKNKGLSLILLIAISNYPPRITAGKIFELSLLTFATVLKTSVLYLNMIRAFLE